MVRAFAFVLLIGLMVAMELTIAPEGLATFRTILLALGFALVAAMLLGDLAERIGLPRLSGYLFFGLICGPYVLNLLTPTMARQLQVVNGLAIALIAFIAGLEINFVRMKKRLAPMLVFGGVTITIMFIGLLAVLFTAWSLLPIAPEAAGLQRLALAIVVTTLIISFSPTVTIAVIAEARARGPLSELVLAVVVLADLALILFFTCAMQFARSMTGASAENVGLFARLLWEIAGSLAFGAALGGAFALYLRFVGREITVVLVGLCVLITGASTWLHFESLLVALSAGVVVENIAPPRGDALRDAVERSALPILVVFFVAAGASLHVDALSTIGVLAIAISVLRAVFIWIGTSLGRRVAKLDPAHSASAWMGMVSQAGVTLGLATIVANEFSGWGSNLQTLVVAMIALHEVIGPMLFRSALAGAGEIGRLDTNSVPNAASDKSVVT
jgi:Kef-type K+ transport system membrane component KefB